MQRLIDANVILRYLLNDNTEMADLAEQVIDEGAFTVPEVLAEVVYVMAGVYKIERADICDALESLLGEVGIENKAAVKEGIHVFRDTSLDFVDCLLIGRHRALGEEVFSFDKKLNKKL